MNKTKNLRIGLIGVGPRGTQILEGLTNQLSLMKNPPRVTVHIISEADIGVGIYDINEPDYLFLNVIADQMSIHPDYSLPKNKTIQSVVNRETFYEWLIKENFKFHGHDISFNDYLPRNLLGKYLNACCKEIIDKLKKIAEVNIYKNFSTKIILNADGSIKLILNNKTKKEITVDRLYLTTGHTFIEPMEREANFIQAVSKLKKKNRNTKANFIYNPYPISKLPKCINHDMTVGIEGMGLAGFDVLASLTIGKGGKFHELEDKEELFYEKSNQEPKIVFYSLSGLPLEGQAVVHRTNEKPYVPIFFTCETINQLRKNFGIGKFKKLDFELHLWPEIIKEMQYVYYRVFIKNRDGDLVVEEFSKKYIKNSSNKHALTLLINNYVEKENQFNWNKLNDPMYDINFNNPHDYKKWMINYLKNDVKECDLGYDFSPHKAACSVLKKIRCVLAYAINFAGLTSDSHQKLLTKYIPIFNRISVGPPKNRIKELLALVEADMIDIFIGKKPTLIFDEVKEKFIITGEHIKNNPKREVDIIIKAKIHPMIPHLDKSPLMKNAISTGLFSEFKNGDFYPGGISINKKHNPISKNGNIHKNIWVLGIPVGGTKFLSDFPLPIGGINPQIWVDTNQIVSDSLKPTKNKKL